MMFLLLPRSKTQSKVEGDLDSMILMKNSKKINKVLKLKWSLPIKIPKRLPFLNQAKRRRHIMTKTNTQNPKLELGTKSQNRKK